MPNARIVLFIAALLMPGFDAAPLLAQAAAPQAQPSPVTGVLKSLDRVPNVPGARCGNHYVLKVATADRKILELKIYDPAASGSALAKMQGKTVEIDLVGETVVRGIRLADEQQAEAAALSNLSTRKPC